MSTGVYTLLFLAGGVSLALWLHVRLSKFAPEKARSCMIHMGFAMFATRIVSPLVGGLLTGTGNPELRFVAVIGIALPALTYALLSFVWMILLIQGSMRRGSLD